jgi:predicted HTH domain antitoxin
VKLNPELPIRRLRCNVCGATLGYSQTKNKISLWCSQDCSETPVSPNEERDEVICELFMQGLRPSELAPRFTMTYQNVQQILLRRGIDLEQRYNALPHNEDDRFIFERVKRVQRYNGSGTTPKSATSDKSLRRA